MLNSFHNAKNLYIYILFQKTICFKNYNNSHWGLITEIINEKWNNGVILEASREFIYQLFLMRCVHKDEFLENKRQFKLTGKLLNWSRTRICDGNWSHKCVFYMMENYFTRRILRKSDSMMRKSYVDRIDGIYIKYKISINLCISYLYW